MPNPIVNRRVVLTGSNIYDPEAVALFGRMTTQPTEARKQLISIFFKGIKADLNIATLSTSFDCLWFFASHAQQSAQLNWVKDAHNITEVNSPTWTDNAGYTSNGTTSYLNTNYNPNTQGVKYLLNTCHTAIYLRTNIGEGLLDCGAADASFNASCFISSRSAVNQMTARLNNSAANVSSNSDSRGLISIDRTTSTNMQHYRNGVANGAADTNATVLIPNLNVFALCRNNSGTAGNFCTKQMAFMSIGSNLNAAGMLALFNRVETFLDAVGAGVI